MASAVLEITTFVLYCLSFLRASEPQLFQRLREYFWLLSQLKFDCVSVIAVWTMKFPYILVKLQGNLSKSGKVE